MTELLLKKAEAIRLVIFDVDGVLTAGELFYGPTKIELKAFHVQDGQGMKMLQQSGVTIAIITARQSEAVSQRMDDLKISHVYQNQSDKLAAYEKLKESLKLDDKQIACVGDDLPDLPLLRRAGLSVTVPNAPIIMQEHAHWVTRAASGNGVAREVCDLIMRAQNTYQPLIEHYLR
ncbi:MAG: hypothetical protein ACD_60C00079G0032 [uncultured bacterium]|nr:MAG: hypothetical protein ACD_60C00079G0032 [uncultured bacterium]